MKKLAIIIVNYNVKHYVEQCLLSLEVGIRNYDVGRVSCDEGKMDDGQRHSTTLSHSVLPTTSIVVYVVDNHSKDGSVEYLKPKFPWVNFIESSHNLGFARANNIAIRQSESEYVLLLNPDTIVTETTITEAIAFMDAHPKAGAAGARMLKTDGSNARESRRGMPTPWVAFYKMMGLCNRYPTNKRFGHYYMGWLPWDEPSQIEVISGAFCLLRRKALDEVGLLDEDFFMYGEDIDLSYRILKGGYENWYVPVSILHYKGESTQKSSFRYVHVFYDAMLIFFRKHYAHASMLITIPIKGAIYMKALSELIKMQISKAKKALGMRKRRQPTPCYLFIGKPESLASCKALAQAKGLEAAFVEGDETALPQGHQGMNLPADGKKTYIVYDTDAYSFAKILSLFAKRPIDGVTLATYNLQTKTIITEEEIIK